MGKKISEVVFEIDSAYNTFTEQLLVSSRVADILIKSVDIKASGNQIESSLRNILSVLLQDKVSVTHGHIIDHLSNVSRQQDLMIVEGFNSKSLLKTLDGTEFLMYESVYATGEVKKRLSKAILYEVIDSVKDLKIRMKRNEVSPNTFATVPDIITSHEIFTSYAFRNPLFSFLVSIDFIGTTDFDSLKDIFIDKNNWKFLPNAIIILNQGIFVLMDMEGVSIKLYPEFEVDNENCKWSFVPFTDINKGRNLAFLIFFLQQHIQDTLLEVPSILQYAGAMLKLNTRTITTF